MRSLWCIVLLALALAGCDEGKPGAGPTPAKEKGKPWVIGMSQCNLGEPWRERR